MGSVLLDLGGRLWRVDEGAEDHKQLLAKGAELVDEPRPKAKAAAKPAPRPKAKAADAADSEGETLGE